MPSLVSPAHILSAIKRRILDRRAHWRCFTRWTVPGSIHQDTTYTRHDRYPGLFGLCRDLLGEQGTHTILSFGCSSGEEVVTLRDYFPRATLVGAELNLGELATCRARAMDDRVAFIRSSRPAIAARGPYDAIFAMAVLQRRPDSVESRGQRNIARHYPFARFEREIAFLTGQLRVGGVLVVEYSQYRVEDSSSAGVFVSIPKAIYPAKGVRFDRAGDLLPSPCTIGRVFRKVADAG